MASLAHIQEIPPKNTILLVGSPGSGKSTFCEQSILQSLALDTPIIYVITECGPSEAEMSLKERGLGEVKSDLIDFIDAYNETVGLRVSNRADTVRADCGDLSSLSVAISKLQNRKGKEGVLLVFDSLTSPYLLNGPEIVRFLRLTLSRFAAEGNSVLVCFDRGSGKEEDLVAMMSISNGVINIELKEGKRVLNVIKHPTVEPTRIEVTAAEAWEKKIYDTRIWDREKMRRSIEFFAEAAKSRAFRRELKQFAVNIFWPNFARWSSMFWDPKRFPKLTYDVWKDYIASSFKEAISLFPWHRRFLFKFMPRNFSKVKDMKKLLKSMNQELIQSRCYGIVQYLEDVSETGEHYIRVHESYECWGFKNVGAAMASYLPPAIAGHLKGLECWKGLEGDWNAVETKCIGLGDPYCEIKLVRGEIRELEDSLEAIDNATLESIHERLMHRLMGFLLHGKPLVERPRLGSDLYESAEMVLPAISSRYRLAFRMGGAKAGKKVGENLMDAGIGENEAVRSILRLLEHCKVGTVTANETIRIRENCESLWTRYYTTKWDEPSCFFTTGFLNGFFSAVKNQHVKETRCISMGDPYCEWAFR